MIKPIQHEHVLEVKIPPILSDRVETIQDHIEENKRSYLFGIGGLVLGVVLTRVFSRPSINLEVNLGRDGLA